MNFKGLNMNQMMKQVEKMQRDMQEKQKEIENSEFEGKAGAGLVTAIVTGKRYVKKIMPDPSLREEDLEVLADLITAAVNDGIAKAEKKMTDVMSTLTAGLPGGLPFGN